LHQPNCIEPDVDCKNCKKFENKLKETLVELSSVQLINRLLQNEPSTTLVLGSQHNLRYGIPLLNKEAVNQQPISNTSKQIKMDGSQPTKISF